MTEVEVGTVQNYDTHAYAPPSEEWLNEQFVNVETLNAETPRAVRIIDIDPPNKTSDIPVFIIGGYGTLSPLHNKANLLAMAREGRRVLYVDEARGIPHGLEPDNVEKIEKIDDYFLDQAAAIRAAMLGKGIHQAAIVGHSEGAIAAAVTAYLHPESISDLILIDPAGLSGEDTLFKLGARFVAEGIINESNRDEKEMSEEALRQAKAGGEGFLKYLRSDIPRNLREGGAMARQSVRNLLKHAHNKGTNISVIHSVNDVVFPMIKPKKLNKEDLNRRNPGWKARVFQFISAPQLSMQQSVDMTFIDGFYSVDDAHAAFIKRPEEWTGMAHDALLKHEMKRKGAGVIANMPIGAPKQVDPTQ